MIFDLFNLPLKSPTIFVYVNTICIKYYVLLKTKVYQVQVSKRRKKKSSQHKVQDMSEKDQLYTNLIRY